MDIEQRFAPGGTEQGNRGSSGLAHRTKSVQPS
jgi:hypothetical protein